MPDPIQVVTLLKLKHPNRQEHGETDWWKANGALYLKRLHAGFQQWHPGIVHKVMTDSPEHVPCGAQWLPLVEDAPGWWQKLWMFSDLVSPDGAKVLYSDLDNVIGGSLEELFALEPEPMFMTDDRVYPGLPNGGLLYFRPDELRYLWRDYLECPNHWHRHFNTWPNASDQAYIAERLRFKGFYREGKIPFLQDQLPPGYILNARAELDRGVDWSNCRISVGSWKFKPQLQSHPYYEKNWDNL